MTGNIRTVSPLSRAIQAGVQTGSPSCAVPGPRVSAQFFLLAHIPPIPAREPAPFSGPVFTRRQAGPEDPVLPARLQDRRGIPAGYPPVSKSCSSQIGDLYEHAGDYPAQSPASSVRLVAVRLAAFTKRGNDGNESLV
jgi:hypothetical protein